MIGDFARRIYLILILLVAYSVGSVAAQNDAERIDFSQGSKEYIVGKIEMSELENLNRDYILSTLNLNTGDKINIPGQEIRDVYRKLWDLRRFSDVKIETTYRADTVDIFLNLKEYLVISEWRIEGVKPGEVKKIREKLNLKNYREYSDYLISTVVKGIRDYYNEKAFRYADISIDVAKDTAKSTYRIVTFNINRGKRVRVGEIKFEGNEALRGKKLAKAMKNTRKQTINFFRNSKFKDKLFPEDLQLVEDYMHSQGYRDGRVLADSTYYLDPKHLGVWIKVEEGNLHHYRNISWIGNSAHSTDELQRMLQFEKGDRYDSETFESRLGTLRKANPFEFSISSLYNDEGYLGFQIEPIETVLPGDSVDVEIRIWEGKPFRISRVTFEGNTKTNDHVIRRELETRPGDLYSQSLLMNSYQRLATMGQFDPMTINPERIPNLQDETVEIKYTFKETGNDQFELSGGWGAGMFIAAVQVKFTNLSVRNFFKKGAWRPYPAGDNQELNLSLQTNGSYYRAFSVGFTEPWLGGRNPNALSVSFFTSRESDASSLWGKTDKYFGTIGGSVSLTKRLNWPDPFFYLTAGVSAQVYRLQNWDYFLLKNGNSTTVALNLGVGRNSVDDPYQYPTSGSDISLSLSITPPFSAMDGKNYADPKLSNSDRYRWIEYHKWNLKAQWYFPLSQNRKLVLMAKAQFGYLGYYNKHKKSPFEGYTMGGDGLTGYSLYGAETIGLRGYGNNALTPNVGYYNQSDYGSIFSKYTAELRYPLMRQGSTMIYGLGFVEAGNVYINAKDFNPFALKRSAGVGVRLFMPVIGMIGFDWGYGFDRATTADTKRNGGEFHFTMGVQM